MTAPLVLGTNNLTFDLVSENNFWFASNANGAGPSNVIYTSPTITISSPTVSAGTAMAAICQGTASAVLGGSFGGTATAAVWSGGAGTFSNNTGSTPGTATYTAGASETGTITLTLTTSGGPCGTVFATKTIVLNATPAAAAGPAQEGCVSNTYTMAANNPTVGTGAWTWSPSTPTYVGGTSASDYNAQVEFSTGGSYTGTWTVSNAPCAAGADGVVVSVASAASNVVLVPGTSVTATEVCVESPWTYYANPATPEEYIFAIAKNGNSFVANVSITDIPGTAPIVSLGGQPNARGTWLISRYWNVTLSSGSISAPVSIRFFIDETEQTAARAGAVAFANANTSLGVDVTTLQWFKTNGTQFNPTTNLVNSNFNFTPTYLTSSSNGSINGVKYYQLDGLTSFSGGTGGYSVNDNGSPLPVELLNFEAQAVNNEYVQLDWSTATEINNDGFEVLRSTDGVNFERIAWVDGNGN